MTTKVYWCAPKTCTPGRVPPLSPCYATDLRIQTSILWIPKSASNGPAKKWRLFFLQKSLFTKKNCPLFIKCRVILVQRMGGCLNYQEV